MSIDNPFFYVYNHTMNQKKAIALTLIILGILAIFMLSDYFKKNGLNNLSVSPNILYITQPVTSFSGIVDKIEGNRLFVSQKQTLTQNILPPVAMKASTLPSPLPTPKTVTVTYRVVTSDKTQISQSATFINYLLKTVTPSPVAKLTIKDVKVGQSVTVSSQTDLRTLAGNTFEATTVNLPQITNTLNGKIVGLEENTLTLKAFTPVTSMANPGSAAPAAPKEKEYRITITSDTEISRMDNQGKPEKLTLTDLKKDMQVTVYTAEDVTESQTLTALRIEPMIPVVMPTLAVPSPVASPSPILSP